MKKYQIIYADPPWPEQGNTCKPSLFSGAYGQRNNKKSEFKTMSIGEIALLPIPQLTDRDCVLFLWCTARHLPFSFEVIKAWGFKYVNVGFAWMKSNRKKGTPFAGLGVWTKQNVELCLFATKGKPYRLLKSHAVAQAIYEPKSLTVKKPEIVYARIERMFGDIPRLELFARQKTKGWDTWGNEVENDVEF